MKQAVIGLAVGAALALPTLSQAATLSHWGTLATVGVADCGGVCDFGGVLAALNGPAAQFGIDSGENALSASTSLVSPSLGTAQASATVTGGDVSLPELRVFASALGTGFTSATALGIQGYDYTGAGETIEVEVNLTGDLTVGGNGLHTELGAFVYLFTGTQLSEFVASPDSVESAFFSFDIFNSADNSAELPDNPPLSEPNPFAARDDGPALLQGSLSIDVPDGTVTTQQFYVAAVLYAFADSDGDIVDGFNTLSLSFADEVDTGALAAASAVPVPAALWAVLAPLGLLLARPRQRA